MDTVLQTLWAVANSPAVVTALAGLLLYAINKLYLKKPLWAQYEGAVIAAVKFAEKEIPDDVANKSLQRLDTALRYVLKVYEQAQGRKATEAEVAEFTNGIQVKHAGPCSRGDACERGLAGSAHARAGLGAGAPGARPGHSRGRAGAGEA